jgi:hypothetical protein
MGKPLEVDVFALPLTADAELRSLDPWRAPADDLDRGA